MERAGFLHEGAVPFALGACERFEVQSVSGRYNEGQEMWENGDNIAAALTLTLTATPGDSDQDRD